MATLTLDGPTDGLLRYAGDVEVFHIPLATMGAFYKERKRNIKVGSGSGEVLLRFDDIAERNAAYNFLIALY